MIIRDRSLGTQGSIQHHGPTHVATSDRAVAFAGSADAHQPDGGASQDPRVPSFHPAPEVSVATGDVEPCSASAVEHGGEVSESLPAVDKSDSGMDAILDKASVSSHPELMAAHRYGSITHKDHNVMHHPSSEGSTMPAMAKPNDSVTKAHGPTVFDGGRSPMSSNTHRVSATPVPTMSEVVKARQENKNPVVVTEDLGVILPRHGRGLEQGPAIFTGDSGRFGSL